MRDKKEVNENVIKMSAIAILTIAIVAFVCGLVGLLVTGSEPVDTEGDSLNAVSWEKELKEKEMLNLAYDQQIQIKSVIDINPETDEENNEEDGSASGGQSSQTNTSSQDSQSQEQQGSGGNSSNTGGSETAQGGSGTETGGTGGGSGSQDNSGGTGGGSGSQSNSGGLSSGGSSNGGSEGGSSGGGDSSGGSTGGGNGGGSSNGGGSQGSSDSYIFADSNSRYLSESELTSLSKDELWYARNEIFARLGRGFGNGTLQEYFDSKSWYTKKYSAEEFDAMDYALFNDYEYKNIMLIMSYEKKMGYR